MKASLVINGFSIGPYIKQDGIKFSKVQRNSKQVTTWDGTLYEFGVSKNKFDVNLMSMPDSEWQTICGYLYLRQPALVTYSDLDANVSYQGYFYVKDVTKTAHKAYGTTTEISNPSFTLEEK